MYERKRMKSTGNRFWFELAQGSSYRDSTVFYSFRLISKENAPEDEYK